MKRKFYNNMDTIDLIKKINKFRELGDTNEEIKEQFIWMYENREITKEQLEEVIKILNKN